MSFFIYIFLGVNILNKRRHCLLCFGSCISLLVEQEEGHTSASQRAPPQPRLQVPQSPGLQRAGFSPVWVGRWVKPPAVPGGMRPSGRLQSPIGPTQLAKIEAGKASSPRPPPLPSTPTALPQPQLIATPPFQLLRQKFSILSILLRSFLVLLFKIITTPLLLYFSAKYYHY